MLKQFITKLLARRHPWRYVGFDELSELYTSTMLRSMGISVIGIFVPIYLYTLSYSIPTICLFMAGVFVSRMAFDVVAGYVTAYFGPKHTILVSNLVQIIALALLLLLAQQHFPLAIIAIVWGASQSLFFIAYHVDFSKIIHLEHSGKELGYMTIVERVGAALGPLVGGMLATLASPQYTIMAAIVLFMAATLPLFMSSEPTATRQRVHFRGLPLRKLARDGVSYFGMGVDTSLSVTLWPLFAAITILTVNTFASIGIVTSLGIISAILAASFIGRVVDKNRGRALFSWSTWANAILHVVRPFVAGVGGVLVVNIANEVLTAGFKMPYYKGMYARAEELPGFRIIYMVFMEVMLDAGKALVWLLVWGLGFVTTPVTAMVVTFIVLGLVTLSLLSQNFPALRPSWLHN